MANIAVMGQGDFSAEAIVVESFYRDATAN